jgi:hypothetical protein
MLAKSTVRAEGLVELAAEGIEAMASEAGLDPRPQGRHVK